MTSSKHEPALSTTAVFRVVSDPDAEPPSRRPDTTTTGSPLGSGTLELIRGKHHRTRFLLGQKIISVGRHPDSEIFLDDVTVSRSHAQFRWLDDEYWIVDMGSLNGTYVNSVRIMSLPLNDGDQIELGKFGFTFTCPPLR